jgi:hypothetical protein
MGIQTLPAPSGGKTMFRTTLTSGTSYTVPAGVTYLNVTLMGGGGGGGRGSQFNNDELKANGLPGEMISSTLSVTGGASIAYAIGAGGTGGTGTIAGTGGTTTFTGATSASGGLGGVGTNAQVVGRAGTAATYATNYGMAGTADGNGGAGGAGCIYVEYWA